LGKTGTKWYSPENYEKYLLLIMTASGFFGFLYLAWVAFVKHNSLTRWILACCFMLTMEAMLFMLMRKRDKYQAKVSATGIEVEAEGEIQENK